MTTCSWASPARVSSSALTSAISAVLDQSVPTTIVRNIARASLRSRNRPAVAYDTILYDVRDDGVATVTLDSPENRNALSNALLSDLIDAFELGARRRARALCRADLLARKGLLRRRLARPVRRRRTARAQALRNGALPAAVQGDHGPGQADDLRGQRSCACGSARAGALLRPGRGQGGRALRNARDQRRGVPLHDHGADLPQRPAQEDQRAAPARASGSRPRRRARRGS